MRLSSHRARSCAVMASSPAANIQPATFFRRRPQRSQREADVRRGVGCVSFVSSEFHTLFMPSGWKMCSPRKSISFWPLTFSTISPAIT